MKTRNLEGREGRFFRIETRVHVDHESYGRVADTQDATWTSCCLSMYLRSHQGGMSRLHHMIDTFHPTTQSFMAQWLSGRLTGGNEAGGPTVLGRRPVNVPKDDPKDRPPARNKTGVAPGFRVAPPLYHGQRAAVVGGGFSLQLSSFVSTKFQRPDSVSLPCLTWLETMRPAS